MPYCHKCGAKLDENARFCYNCGTPVTPVATAAPTAPRTERPMRRNPFFIPVAVLVGIVLTALILSAIVFTPINNVNFNQTNEIDQPNADHLSLNFQADVAAVNIYTNLTDQTFLLKTSASGSTGILGSNNPVEVTVTNSTVDNAVSVNVKVSTRGFLSYSNLNLVCNIYVNPALILNISARSTTGQVIINAEAPTTLESLNLETTTGSTQANLGKGVMIEGNVLLKTTTGTVNFEMNQANVHGNDTLNLQSTTGSVNVNITKTDRLSGNPQVTATTVTGSVNLNLLIDGDVGARIQSHTDLGNIRLQNVQNFSGNQSPIQSNNYPAGSNFQMDFRTTTGEINIYAVYETTAIPTARF